MLISLAGCSTMTVSYFCGLLYLFFFHDTATTAIYTDGHTLSLHDALPISFPREDLDVDGQPGGQVGQEIYGAGAAFVFATRSFHEVSRPFGCNIGSGIHSRPKQTLNENS